MVKVLFVCLGNICRSPLAEGIFLDKVAKAGLADHIAADSCGTGGWHIGELPDPRSREVAREHQVVLPSRARQLETADFSEFDLIIAMDDSNLLDLQREMKKVYSPKAALYKMRHFDIQAPEADVPDPYYGGKNGFYDVYDMLDRSCEDLLAFIKETYLTGKP